MRRESSVNMSRSTTNKKPVKVYKPTPSMKKLPELWAEDDISEKMMRPPLAYDEDPGEILR